MNRQEAATRTELLLKLQRIGVQKQVLQSARAEATHRLAQLEREGERLENHLRSLDRGDWGEEEATA
jgi:hypothetical protein